MKIHILSYVATAIVFLGIDAVWLTFTGRLVYRPILGDVLQPKFSPAPAAIFCLLYVAGIVIFAVAPAAGARR